MSEKTRGGRACEEGGVGHESSPRLPPMHRACSLPPLARSVSMASSLLLCLLFLSAAAAAGAAAVNPRRSLAAPTAKSGNMAMMAAGSPMVAGLMNERLKALTTSFAQQMGREFHYCIKNM